MTGEPPPPPDCILDPEPGKTAFRYQCAGDFEAVLSLMVNGASRQFPAFGSFGDGVEGDSYDPAPVVMACCTVHQDPTCSQPHIRACHYDFVEQSCASIVNTLRTTANELTPENSGLDPGTIPAAKDQIRQLANWLASNQQMCFEHFVIESGIRQAYACTDGDESAVDYSDLLSGTTWDLPETAETLFIKNPVITLSNVNINGLYPSDADQLASCVSMDDNHNMYLEAPPPPPSEITTVVPAPTANPSASTVLPE